MRLSVRATHWPAWNRFRRNLTVSLTGSVLAVAIKLGQTALLTRELSVTDFGRVLIVLNLFVFLQALLGLRVSDLIFRFYQSLRETRDTRALQALLLLCACICLATGLLISAGVIASSSILAEHFYHSPALAPLFRIYGLTVLVSTFSELYEPILRLHNRFTSIVIPQVLGGLTTLCVLAAYFSRAEGYDLKMVVGAFTIGALVQTVPPLALALRLVKPYLSLSEVRAAAQALNRYRRELARSLFHSNLSGYLKFSIDPGDVFLLGLFSTPAQVALYGLARQLTAPLALFQTNAQTAIAPEVISLAAKRRFAELKRLVGRYAATAFVIGAAAVACGLLIGRAFIEWLARAEYLAALPVFYALLIIAALMLVAAAFRPLSVALDMMRWYNLGLLMSAIVVLVFVIAGRLDAMTMAYAQLTGALILRVFCNAPQWFRLSALASDSGLAARREEALTEK